MNAQNKVIVISHFGFDNYGSRLQNHAVIYLLKKYGIQAIAAAPYDRPLLQVAKDVFKLILPSSIWPKKGRYKNFRSFAKRYTPYRIIPATALEDVVLEYRCAVVGSDQVWSPYYLSTKRKPQSYFLTKVSGDSKIALSPSFGLSNIPAEMEEMYVVGLNSFTRLSVREDVGAKIIKQLTGMEASVLADPTMGVTADYWRSIANYNICPREKYMLSYYLGDTSAEVSECVNKYLTERSLDTVDLMNRSGKFYKTGPAEFISLIDKASYIVTDSFHGTVFSLLLNKPFCIVNRVDKRNRDMYSRLETLVRITGCEDRVYTAGSGNLPECDIDWCRVNENIGRERDRLLDYLAEELVRCGLA